MGLIQQRAAYTGFETMQRLIVKVLQFCKTIEALTLVEQFSLQVQPVIVRLEFVVPVKIIPPQASPVKVQFCNTM